MQVMGSYQAAKAENRAADYNADIANQNAYIQEQNAVLAEDRAADSTRRGEIEEKQHRLRVSQMIGGQKTSFAGSGVVVGEGSALQTTQDTASLGEFDALTIRHNAASEAWGHNMSARNERLQGDVFKSQAEMHKASKRSPLLSAGTTLLTGGTSLSKQFL